MAQKGSGLFIRQQRVMLFQIYPYANSIQEQLLLAQTQGQSVYAVPILPKHISTQYRSDALFLGKDIESKEDCWLMPVSYTHLQIYYTNQNNGNVLYELIPILHGNSPFLMSLLYTKNK